MTVKYDPDNPSRAMIDSAVQSGLLFTVIGVVIAVVGLMGGTFGLWASSQI